VTHVCDQNIPRIDTKLRANFDPASPAGRQELIERKCSGEAERSGHPLEGWLSAGGPGLLPDNLTSLLRQQGW
jgi:hypothetical protein